MDKENYKVNKIVVSISFFVVKKILNALLTIKMLKK